MSLLESWGFVTLQNYQQKCEQTKQYGHYRLILGLYLSKLLNQLHSLWWLDAGSLLGAYRDGKMIAHDTDFDLAVLATEQEFTDLYSNLVSKVDGNFHLRKIDTFCRRIEIFDPHFGSYILDSNHKLSYHNVTVNIQLYTPHENNQVKIMYFKDDFADQVSLKKDKILPLGSIKYCGHSFHCPHQVEKYLEEFYSYLGLGAEYDKVTRKYKENASIPKNVSNKADEGNHDNLKNQ